MNKLTTETINILKNFSGINKNLLVKAGSELSTISEAKNIYAVAKVTDEFENEFGIYDLNEFLSIYGLLDEPEVSFDDNSLELKAGNSSVRYRFADSSILTYPTKKINMPAADVVVSITSDVLTQVKKAAAALGHSVVSIKKNSGCGKILLSVVDPKNSTANTYSIVLAENEADDVEYDLQFLIANLKVISGDYAVSISSRLISKWEHESQEIEYYIALEKSSTYTA